MANVKPQFWRNDLKVIGLERETLERVLLEFREAVRCGIALVSERSEAPDINDAHVSGTIYNGDLGIVIMALRLQRQAKYLPTEDVPIENLILELQKLVNTKLKPHNAKGSCHPGRISPLGSASLGAAVVRIIAAAQRFISPSGNVHHRVHQRDILAIRAAMDVALQQGTDIGGDELLYGRVGLLHALLNIRNLQLDDESKEALEKLAFKDISQLVDHIVNSGKLGARDYLKPHGEQESMPLMWPWHGKYYTGAIHGTCGILDILLECEPEELGDGHAHSHLPIIAQTTNALCDLCILNEGHLPSSVPQRSTSRTSPLVQICHGAPGLLALLSNARNKACFAASHWQVGWDQAIRLASKVSWEQGLLYKGGSLCHGIAGNAWPLLMLHDTLEYGPQGPTEARDAFNQLISSVSHRPKLSADTYLSRAIAFLLEARNTQPFQVGPSASQYYRMPDNPYSLFEGLAGTICAWAEVCVVITAKLEETDAKRGDNDKIPSSDGDLGDILQNKLGMPGLSVRGYL